MNEINAAAAKEIAVYSLDGPIGFITLNRPETGNALDSGLVEGIDVAFDRAIQDGARLIVFRGTGKHFCTGFDLSDLENCSDADLLLRFVRIERLLQKIYRSPVMTAAIGCGRVYGAGADIFAACDRRVALHGSFYTFPGAGFGLILGSRRLGVRVGPDMARRIIVEGRKLSDSEAKELGLASDTSDPESLNGLLKKFSDDSSRLSADTVSLLHDVTCNRDDNADLAALVISASKPGLKNRIRAYRDKTLRKST